MAMPSPTNGPGLASSPPAAGSCAAVDAGTADRLFRQWAERVRAGDPEAVADLYADDALLLPTLSPRPRGTHAAIADYFSGFAVRHPRAEVIEHALYAACNQVVDAGLYRFRFPATSTAAETVVEARFTLVYGFRNQQWRLLHHHSSLLPGSAPVGPVDP